MTLINLSMTAWLYVGCVVLSAVLVKKVLNIGRRPADIPPGPPTIPILGNLHQMPIDKPHLQLQKWAQEYG
jgi:hypothetical protein